MRKKVALAAYRVLVVMEHATRRILLCHLTAYPDPLDTTTEALRGPVKPLPIVDSSVGSGLIEGLLFVRLAG